MKRKSTITDLPNDIKAAVPHWEQNEVVKQIIELAENKQFHCFKSSFDFPKNVLVNSILTANESALIPIRNAVFEGGYDESPDAEDKAAMKKDWIDNGGTEDSYNVLFGE